MPGKRPRLLVPEGLKFGMVPAFLARWRGPNGERVTSEERDLYASLWLAYFDHGGAFPGLSVISEQYSGFKTRATGVRAQTGLVAKGFLRITRADGRENDYQLLDGSGVVTLGTGAPVAPVVVAAPQAPAVPEGAMRQLTDLWAADGSKFGPRDGKAAADMLKAVGLDAALQVSRWAIQHGRQHRNAWLATRCCTLAGTWSAWNEVRNAARLAGQLTPDAQGGPAVGQKVRVS